LADKLHSCDVFWQEASSLKLLKFIFTDTHAFNLLLYLITTINSTHHFFSPLLYFMFIFIVVEFDDDFLRRFRIDSAFNQFKINYLASHKYLKLIGIGLQLIN